MRRILFRTILPLVVFVIAACATQDQYSSGRLAKVSPNDFISIKPEAIAVGVDVDSRVPASPNRAPDLLVGVLPVDHNAWEPIGARLRMRPITLVGDSPDSAGGKSLRRWMNSPGGRIRLTYVLTNESKDELKLLQQKFADLLKKYPPSSGKRGSLRIRIDSVRMIEPDSRSRGLTLANNLQLSISEGPFVIWAGRVEEMR